ncbi:MAG: hypothetical protein KKH04_10825 [Proteobacteria bacterium]|nr:hypothetical protein [Pseudomonadota bacterium]
MCKSSNSKEWTAVPLDKAASGFPPSSWVKFATIFAQGKVMDFLERGVDDEEPEKLVEEGESYEPEDLAWLVVDRLDSRMSA